MFLDLILLLLMMITYNIGREQFQGSSDTSKIGGLGEALSIGVVCKQIQVLWMYL